MTSGILERFYKAYWMFSPIDLKALKNLRARNMGFVGQSALDIYRKLWILEGFEGKVISELTEVAWRVFNSGEDIVTVQGKKMGKGLLAALEQG